MKVRMLVDSRVEGVLYRCNQVVELSEAAAKSLIANGEADGHKEAVAYCVETLKSVAVVHPGAEAETPKRKKG